MKKLLIVACSVLLLVACKPSTDKDEKKTTDTTSKLKAAVDTSTCPPHVFDRNKVMLESRGASPDSTYRSLNGIGRDSAIKMINQYKANKDKAPYQVSFFFKKEMVEKLVDLLCDEKADGVRIYFAAKIRSTQNRSATTIILLPTKDCGPSIYLKGFRYHGDYFNHKRGIPYFNTSNTAFNTGEKSDDRSINSPADLYTRRRVINPQTDTVCDRNNNHAITRTMGSDMVLKWDDPKKTNNTVAAWYPVSVFREVLKSKDCSGMRIYFARYADYDDAPMISGRNTFVIAATKLNGRDHVDNYECPIGLSSAPLVSDVKFFGDVQDVAELCPDNCTICDPNDPTAECGDHKKDLQDKANVNKANKLLKSKKTN